MANKDGCVYHWKYWLWEGEGWGGGCWWRRLPNGIDRYMAAHGAYVIQRQSKCSIKQTNIRTLTKWERQHLPRSDLLLPFFCLFPFHSPLCLQHPLRSGMLRMWPGDRAHPFIQATPMALNAVYVQRKKNDANRIKKAEKTLLSVTFHKMRETSLCVQRAHLTLDKMRTHQSIVDLRFIHAFRET